MRDRANHAVSRRTGTDGCTERGCNSLMPKTDAKDGYLSVKIPNHIHRATCLEWPLGARRQNDSSWIEPLAFAAINLIAAHHERISTQPPQITGKVMNKGVVIIEEQNHRLSAWFGKLDLFNQFDIFIALFVPTYRSN